MKWKDSVAKIVTPKFSHARLLEVLHYDPSSGEFTRIKCHRGHPVGEKVDMANCRRLARNTSGFKGVTWAKRERKWVASLSINKKSVNLGYFDDPEMAAMAVRVAAKEAYHGYWRAA